MGNQEKTHTIHLLKSRVGGMDATIKHLHGLVSSHMKALEALYSKGIDSKPVKIKTSSLQSASLMDDIAAMSTSILKSKATGLVGKQVSNGIASGAGGMSQGQVLGQFASLLSRASSRNL